MKNDLVLVARLGRTLGLKGFVKLHDLSDFPKQFKKGATFFDAKGSIYTIKQYDINSSSVLFEAYEDIKSAKELVNLKLYQSIEQSKKTCKLKKDEYFYFDILNLQVFEDDILLGELVDILETSSSHLLLIKVDEKLVKQGFAKEFYLPYVDHYVSKVDLEEKKIFASHALLLLESL